MAFFVLFTNYSTIESSIRDGSNFYPVPLYRLPKTCDDDFYDIICWQSDYRYCDGLQMGCLTGERFGIKEISKFDSSLSQRGREICQKLSEKTGKPFYYYLYRRSAKSAKAEEERCCPICGSKNWKIEHALHGMIDFKCDTCRIVSNMAWNVRR